MITNTTIHKFALVEYGGQSWFGCLTKAIPYEVVWTEEAVSMAKNSLASGDSGHLYNPGNIRYIKRRLTKL